MHFSLSAPPTSAPSTSVTPSTSTVTSGSAITLAISQSAYNVSSGSTVTFNITVSASPAITSVTWYRVSPTGVRTNVSIDGLNYGGATLAAPSLVIYNVDSVDSGSYMCVVSNGQQTDESGVMDLTVRGSKSCIRVLDFMLYLALTTISNFLPNSCRKLKLSYDFVVNYNLKSPNNCIRIIGVSKQNDWL